VNRCPSCPLAILQIQDLCTCDCALLTAGKCSTVLLSRPKRMMSPLSIRVLFIFDLFYFSGMGSERVKGGMLYTVL